MKRIDMHTHTTASDGVLTPTELIQYARLKGLGGIAVTDHDTVEGLSEAREAAAHYKDFWLLPGIEFSTEVEATEVHLLGYGIDESNEKLLSLLKELKDSRLNRSEKMVKKLCEMGIPITNQQVKNYAGDGIVGRVHVARVLVDLHVVSSIQDAFQRYLNRNQPGYVPRFKLSPHETIPFIHELGGFSVLAHPGLMNDDELITGLVDAGLMGIEAYYPGHSHDDEQRYLRLAYQQNLLVTGGSDFHAPPKHKIRDSDIGQCSMPINPIFEYYKELRRRQKQSI